MSNLELWDKVSKTNPLNTKEVGFGRKFTAIDAYSQIKHATEEFGSYGKAWGLNVLEHTIEEGLCIIYAEFWYPDGKWKTANSIAIASKKGVDTDFMKKIETDTLTKCLSRLGFNADVFMGKFEDNKYVESMNTLFNSYFKSTHDKKKVYQGILDAIKKSDTIEGLKATMEEDYKTDLEAFASLFGDEQSYIENIRKAYKEKLNSIKQGDTINE